MNEKMFGKMPNSTEKESKNNESRIPNQIKKDLEILLHKDFENIEEKNINRIERIEEKIERIEIATQELLNLAESKSPINFWSIYNILREKTTEEKEEFFDDEGKKEQDFYLEENKYMQSGTLITNDSNLVPKKRFEINFENNNYETKNKKTKKKSELEAAIFWGDGLEFDKSVPSETKKYFIEKEKERITLALRNKQIYYAVANSNLSDVTTPIHGMMKDSLRNNVSDYEKAEKIEVGHLAEKMAISLIMKTFTDYNENAILNNEQILPFELKLGSNSDDLIKKADWFFHLTDTKEYYKMIIEACEKEHWHDKCNNFSEDENLISAQFTTASNIENKKRQLSTQKNAILIQAPIKNILKTGKKWEENKGDYGLFGPDQAWEIEDKEIIFKEIFKQLNFPEHLANEWVEKLLKFSGMEPISEKKDKSKEKSEEKLTTSYKRKPLTMPVKKSKNKR